MKTATFTIARPDTGAVLRYASVTVYAADGVTRATIYNADGSAQGNPITANVNGEITFAAPDGTYILSAVSADDALLVPNIAVDLLDVDDFTADVLRESNAVFSANYASVEAAYAAAITTSKTKLVVNSPWTMTGHLSALVTIEFASGYGVICNGFNLNLKKGFIAHDTQWVFLKSDRPYITQSPYQRLTPFHYGAHGNYVDADNPGTDDTDAMVAWAGSYCNRVLPSAKFGITSYIPWNGTPTASIMASSWGMLAEPGAAIVQRTDNMPILCVYGDRGDWALPHLYYENVQPTTNYSAVALLITPQPGRTGFYSNNIRMFHSGVAITSSLSGTPGGAATGLFNPRGFGSTLASAAAADATSITVSNAQTDPRGNYPWMPGMFVQIRLTSGNWHITRLTTVSGATLGLQDKLPTAAASGNVVAVSSAIMVNPSDTPGASARFSNTWSWMQIDMPTLYGVVDTGIGTQEGILNLYIKAPIQPDKSLAPFITTLQSAYWCQSRDGDFVGVLNVEGLGHLDFMVYTSGSGATHFQHSHFEGNRVYADNKALFSGSMPTSFYGQVQVLYQTAIDTDVATSFAIFRPISAGSTRTSVQGGHGAWEIDHLHTGKNMIGTRAFPVSRPDNNLTDVRIKRWTFDRDGGFNPRALGGQLQSPSNLGAVWIGSLMDEDCVGYAFRVNLNSTSYQPVFTRGKGQYRLKQAVLVHPSVSLASGGATAGLYSNTGGTLVSSSGTVALASLTDSTTALDLPLDAGEVTKLRAGRGANLYFKMGTAKGLGSPISAAYITLTGRNGGNDNTNLCIIEFASAHGLTRNATVNLASGTVVTGLNDRNWQIVDVPSATQIVIYYDSATALARTAETALQVRQVPTANLWLKGELYPNFDAL